MELRWLEDFLSLARTKSFSRSAAERHGTQSAFSRRIQALERWVGAPLLDRSTFPARLTNEGEAFREAAEQFVHNLTRARDDARTTLRRAETTLVFSATHSVALSFFPEWLKSVQQVVGPVDAQMLTDNMHNCIQNLIEGACDFLICFSPQDRLPLIEAERYPAVHLADDRLIPVSAVADDGSARYVLPGTPQHPLPYLSYSATSFLGCAVADLVVRPDRQCHLSTRYEDSLAVAIAAMARAGHGLAWVPESLVVEDLSSGRLERAGGSQWDVPFGISIHRCVEPSRPRVEALWSALCAGTQG